MIIKGIKNKIKQTILMSSPALSSTIKGIQTIPLSITGQRSLKYIFFVIKNPHVPL
ncbi:uncharacterized protein DS421_16g549720 [Arachis hypogaea]|nr:uncharacterized protein DS421_16g549720 [Arachis hypogaea]